jgi:transposase-like protein
MRKRTRRGDPQRQRYWEEVVRRWREGGQSVAAFCRGEGLRESAFYCWRRKLARRSDRTGERAPDAGDGSRPAACPVTPAPRLSRQSAAPPFLPVHVVEHAMAEVAHGVEIVLRQGRAVRVGVGFDRQTLAEVLAVLETAPC